MKALTKQFFISLLTVLSIGSLQTQQAQKDTTASPELAHILHDKDILWLVIQEPPEYINKIMASLQKMLKKEDPVRLQKIDPLFFDDVSKFSKIYTVIAYPRNGGQETRWYVAKKPSDEVITLNISSIKQLNQQTIPEKIWKKIESYYQSYPPQKGRKDPQSVFPEKNIELIRDESGIIPVYAVHLKDGLKTFFAQDIHKKPYYTENINPNVSMPSFYMLLPQNFFDMIEKLYKEKFVPKLNPSEAKKYSIKWIGDAIKDKQVVGDSKNIDKQYGVVFEKEPHIIWMYSKDKQGNITAFIRGVRPKNNQKQKIAAETFKYIEEYYLFNKDNILLIIQESDEGFKSMMSHIKDDISKKKPSLLQEIDSLNASQFSKLYLVRAALGKWVNPWYVGKKTSGQIVALMYTPKPFMFNKEILLEETWDRIESLYKKYNFSLPTDIQKMLAAENIISIKENKDDNFGFYYDITLKNKYELGAFQDVNNKPYVMVIHDPKKMQHGPYFLSQKTFDMIENLYKEKFAPKINPENAHNYAIKEVEDTIESKEVVGDSKNIDKQFAVTFKQEPHITWIYSKDKQGNITAFIHNARPKNNQKQKISEKTFNYIEAEAKKVSQAASSAKK